MSLSSAMVTEALMGIDKILGECGAAVPHEEVDFLGHASAIQLGLQQLASHRAVDPAKEA